jgi:hypothetical protein
MSREPELEVLHGIETRHWPLIQALVAEVHDVDGRLAHIRAMLEREWFAEISTEHDALNFGSRRSDHTRRASATRGRVLAAVRRTCGQNLHAGPSGPNYCRQWCRQHKYLARVEG